MKSESRSSTRFWTLTMLTQSWKIVLEDLDFYTISEDLKERLEEVIHFESLGSKGVSLNFEEHPHLRTFWPILGNVIKRIIKGDS
jgi:hypothetical protein